MPGARPTSTLRRVSPDQRSAPVSTVTTRLALAPDGSLDLAMEKLVEAGAEMAPVVEEGAPVGLVTTRSILRAYRSALEARRGQRDGVARR